MDVESMLVGFGTCLICCAVLFAVVQRDYTKRLNDMSSQISTSTSLNEQLRTTNSDLERRNVELTATIDGLGKQISDDNKRNQQTIAGLKNTIAEISGGISSASGTVEEVIKRINDIKIEIGNLK